MSHVLTEELTQVVACRVESDDMTSTVEEEAANVPSWSASALRLLYACLSPLEGKRAGKIESYAKFLETAPSALKKRLSCDDVLLFLRRALHVPFEEHLMLLLLVDEGDAACGTFPRGKGAHPPKVSLWDHSKPVTNVWMTAFVVVS